MNYTILKEGRGFEISKLLGNRVKKLRKYRDGISQTVIGDILKVKKSAISMIENGKRGLDYNQLKTLCDKFKIDARWFFDENIKNIEDADLTLRENAALSPSEVLAKEVKALRADFNIKIRPTEELDKVTDRVRVNFELRRVISHFYLEPKNILDQLEIGIIKDLEYIKHGRYEKESV